MPNLHVCSLQRMYGTVRESGAGDLVSVIKAVTKVPTPDSIHPARHLMLNFSDITEKREGETIAEADHIRQLLDFVRGWTREKPLLIHCYAGVSRSTASAFITACALRPERSEAQWALDLRDASPTATPNAHLVWLADSILEREGRMIRAIEAIGRGRDCFEGIPFSLPIGGG
jgi:predicted protein tyrosine phosphatase